MNKNKPQSSEEVYNIMKSYCDDKHFSVSDASLRYWAEDCYLFFESRGWKNIKYWPAVAMRWCLTNVKKLPKDKSPTNIKPFKQKPKGKTIRERILEEQDEK